MSYALVTPVRDEAENLARLGDCIVRQTMLPTQWVIVDNGSRDETAAVAERFAAADAWVTVLSSPATPRAVPGAPIVRAFKRGVEALQGDPDVIVKLDADVSFGDDYFERVVRAFAERERLGIASGVCLELDEGEWRPTHVTGDHARGAARAYRAACLAEVSPLEERVGWDGIDELKATVLGWETGILPIPFRHHRPVGIRDGSRFRRWSALGECSHYMGYRWSYLLVRAAFQVRRDRAAVAMVVSFVAAAARRKPRLADSRAVEYLRDQQRLRHLPQRAREATGRRA